MATANPAMSPQVYRRAGLAEMPTRAMTLRGTVLKTVLLVAILLATAAYTWAQAAAGAMPVAYALLVAGALGGFLVRVERLNPAAPGVDSRWEMQLYGLVRTGRKDKAGRFLQQTRRMTRKASRRVAQGVAELGMRQAAS